MKSKILFLHGLWLNPNGFLAKEIEKAQVHVLPLLGMTMEQRLHAVLEYLDNNKQIHTVVAHSAGCLVARHALEIGIFGSQIKKLILLNPAPLPGIPFTMKDKVWWAIFRYLPKIFFDKKVGLTREHTLSLLSLDPEQLSVLEGDFLPDSSEFVRGIVLGQFQFLEKDKEVLNRHGTKVVVVHTEGDNMVGTTPLKTVKRFLSAELVTMRGGHMYTLINFRQVVGDLIGK